MLVTHPKVMDAAVFGIPDDEMGQTRQGRRADRRPGRRHRRVRRGTAGVAAGSAGALQVSAVDLVRGAAAAHRHRQALQAEPDREVLGAGRLTGARRRPVDPPGEPPPAGVVVAVGDPSAPTPNTGCSERLSRSPRSRAGDRRTVTVPSVPDGARRARPSGCARWPQAAAVCDDVLRAVDVDAPAFPGVITESLAYSTLQSGPEFARWLAERGPAHRARDPRSGGRRARRRHAARRGSTGRSGTTRSPPMPARRCSRRSRSPGWTRRSTEVVLGGNGPSFCSGGDLAEFGTFADPASAHLARTRHSPALVLDEITARLGIGVPRRGARSGAGQRAGDGGVLRARDVPPGRGARPAGAGAGPDSRARAAPSASPGGSAAGAPRIWCCPGRRSTRPPRWTGAWSTPSSDFGALGALTATRAPKSQLAGAAQRHPVGVLLGQEVADRQLDGRARRRRSTAGRPAASDGPASQPTAAATSSSAPATVIDCAASAIGWRRCGSSSPMTVLRADGAVGQLRRVEHRPGDRLGQVHPGQHERHAVRAAGGTPRCRRRRRRGAAGWPRRRRRVAAVRTAPPSWCRRTGSSDPRWSRAVADSGARTRRRRCRGRAPGTPRPRRPGPGTPVAPSAGDSRGGATSSDSVGSRSAVAVRARPRSRPEAEWRRA